MCGKDLVLTPAHHVQRPTSKSGSPAPSPSHSNYAKWNDFNRINWGRLTLKHWVNQWAECQQRMPEYGFQIFVPNQVECVSLQKQPIALVSFLSTG